MRYACGCSGWQSTDLFGPVEVDLNLKTVLIFAHECAPYNRVESTMGAQRPAQFARYLPEFGWRAIVICCDSRRRRSVTRADLGQIADLAQQLVKESDPGESVVIPIPSLVWDGLLDRCWHRSLKGSSPRVVRKALTAAKFLTGDYSQSWQPCARAVARAIAQKVPIDLCIGEHGPDAGLFLARWFSREFGVKWIADFRDPILQPLGKFARKLYSPVVKRLLATASSTINVNPDWSEQDQALFGVLSRSIPNGFDPEEFEGAVSRDSHKFTIAYVGSITISQQLEVFFEGLAQLRSMIGQRAAENVRFLYAGSATKKVSDLASRYRLLDIVEAQERVERGVAISLMESADALLLLSIGAPASKDIYFRSGYYPGKTFEYFGARRPILCVPGDKGQLENLIRDTGTGVVLRTAADVAAHLARAVDKWKCGRPLDYRPNEESVERFTRRNLTQKLAEHLEEVVGLAPGKRAASEDLVAAGSLSIQGVRRTAL